MSWERKKLKVKQPGIEEEEDMMSRHLDTVATSTLNQKQSRHQRASEQQVATSSAQEKRSRHQSEVATAVVKKRGRDNNSTERKSRQHLAVTTSIVKT